MNITECSFNIINVYKHSESKTYRLLLDIFFFIVLIYEPISETKKKNSFDLRSLSQLPVFQQNFGGILVLDEIGRMELLSDRFREEVKKAFSNPSFSILATIPATPLSFSESLRHSPNTTVFMVSSYDEITAVVTIYIVAGAWTF
jgi:nucleoside-triphosphatase THEP1